MHAHLQKLLTTTECWCSLLLTLLNCTKLTRRLNVFIYFFVNVFLVLRSHLVKLNDVCLQVSSGPSISQFSGLGINDQRYLPTKGCLLLSPANLWNRSSERWELEPTILCWLKSYLMKLRKLWDVGGISGVTEVNHWSVRHWQIIILV